MKYKVGDRVSLRKNLIDGEMYGDLTFYDFFYKKIPDNSTIFGVTCLGRYNINGWCISEEMLQDNKEKYNCKFLKNNEKNNAPVVKKSEYHWIKKGQLMEYHCEKCGAKALYKASKKSFDYYQHLSQYCPNCGERLYK